MPAGTKFTSTVDGVSYQFVTITSRSISSSGNTINFDNTEIYEGTYVTTKYTVDNSDTEQRFIITDNRVGYNNTNSNNTELIFRYIHHNLYKSNRHITTYYKQ